MKIPERAEVVVVGGGPAGSSSATYLARQGVDVVLLEKQKHPRNTVGESLIPLFWRYTDALGVSEKLAAEGFVQKMGGTVKWKDQIRTHTFKTFGYDRPALHVERDRFDFILLEHARVTGARIFERVSVTGVNFDEPGKPVISYRDETGGSGRISCSYVVDATGQSSILARQFGTRKFDENFKFMSIWGYFRGSRYIAFGGKSHPAEDLFVHPPTTFVTSLEEFGDMGWGWHIIMREETSVGFVLPADGIKSHRGGQSWEAYFLRLCRSTYGFNELLQEAEFVPESMRLIRDYSYRAEQLSGPGYYLVGDAAGFIDPIFSIGVVLAFYSAYAAAWAIERSLRQPERAEDFRRLFDSQLGARIEMSRMLALPAYSPDGDVGDLARAALAWQNNSARDLLSAVTRLTSRSVSLNDSVDEISKRELSADAIIQLERLDL